MQEENIFKRREDFIWERRRRYEGEQGALGSEFSSSSDESSLTLVEDRKSLEVIDISLDQSYKEMPIKYKSP